MYQAMGAVFRSSTHDLSTVIPEGAIYKGVLVSIEIGLTPTCPFDYPSLEESKPVCTTKAGIGVYNNSVVSSNSMKL